MAEMVDVVGRAEQLIREAVEEEGFELIHVEYAGASGSPILRAYVDRPGGITVSDCAEISRRVSVLLDVEDFIPKRYVLEVSSPGIERPLFSEADFLRFKGEEVRLVTLEKIDNRRKFVGIIAECNGGLLELDCEGQSFSIPMDQIKKANLVYRFD